MVRGNLGEVCPVAGLGGLQGLGQAGQQGRAALAHPAVDGRHSQQQLVLLVSKLAT